MSGSVADPYAELGEFHDLFMVQPWERLRPHVRRSFGDLLPTATVVEIGAGTGLGTRVLLQESRARIVALEPSTTMRSILLARVADDSAAIARVTVLAGSVPDDLGLLPEVVDAAMCTHVLGHLSRTARQRLLCWLGGRLPVGGRALVTTPDPDANDPVGVVREHRRIGDLGYAVRHQQTSAGTFRSVYTVTEGERILRELDVEGRWDPVTTADLRGDLEGTGLAVDGVEDGVTVLLRART